MKKRTLDETLDYREKVFKRRMNIRAAKCHDYADITDVLANFERVSLICNLLDIDVRNPIGYCLLMVVLKLDRICNLVFRQKEKPKNESVQDSFIDMANYVDLAEEIALALGVIEDT